MKKKIKRLELMKLINMFLNREIDLREGYIISESRLPIVPSKYLIDPKPREIPIVRLTKGSYPYDLAAVNDAISYCFCNVPTLLNDKASVNQQEFELWKIGLNFLPKDKDEITEIIKEIIIALNNYSDLVISYMEEALESNSDIVKIFNEHNIKYFFIRKNYLITATY
jgi:hypothetical protein